MASPNRRIRARLATLAAVGAAALLGAGVWSLVNRARAASRPDDVLPRVAVRRAVLAPTLRAGGLVESSKRTLVECQLENLQYSNEGRTISAAGSTILELIPEGSTVHKGDVLCRLDSSAYEELVLQ